MLNMTADSFCLGGLVVRPPLNLIERHDGPVHVEPRTMRLLCRLAEARGAVVERTEIVSCVWPDVIVTDDSLTGAISQLRRALGDDARAPSYIETIPKRGYRLLVPVGIDGDIGGERTAVPVWRSRWWPWAIAAGVVGCAWAFDGSQTAPSEHWNPGRPMSTDPLLETTPELAPDGNSVVYVKRGWEGDHDLFVQDLTTGSSRAVTQLSGFEFSPTWSPDGTSIAFLHISKSPRVVTIKLLNLVTEKLTEIGRCSDFCVAGLSFAPDGNKIAFVDRAEEGGPFQLGLISIHDGKREILTSPSRESSGDHSPAFSPDGSVIAFVRNTSNASLDHVAGFTSASVHVLDLASRQLTTLDESARGIWGVSWSPDGKDLIYAAEHVHGSYGLWRATPQAGTASAPLMQERGRIRFPSIDRRGRLAYELSENEIGLFELDDASPGHSLRPFATSTQVEHSPSLDAVGERMAFISRRTGNSEVWVAERNGRSRQITSFGGAELAHPSLSADGHLIAFHAVMKGIAQIYLADVERGTWEVLTTGSFHNLAPSFSSDGKFVFFASDRSGSLQVWKLQIENGSLSQLTEDGGFRALEGADGSVYFCRLDEPGIWRLDPRESNPVLVVPDHWEKDWINWSLDGDSLVHLKRLDYDEGFLESIDLRSGESVEVLRLDASDHQGQYLRLEGISKSSGRLLIAREIQVTSDIFLTELSSP